MLVKNAEDCTKVEWYLLSDTRLVSVHVAYKEHPFSNPDTDKVMFVSDNKTFAGVTAERMGIRYAYLRNASPAEIAEFFENSDLVVEKIIEV